MRARHGRQLGSRDIMKALNVAEVDADVLKRVVVMDNVGKRGWVSYAEERKFV